MARKWAFSDGDGVRRALWQLREESIKCGLKTRERISSRGLSLRELECVQVRTPSINDTEIPSPMICILTLDSRYCLYHGATAATVDQPWRPSVAT